VIVKLRRQGGHWVWRARVSEPTAGTVEVVFAGRGPSPHGREEVGAVLGRLEPEPPPVAWARQVHSARVLEARPGECGEGDALFTEEAGVALAVVTADCVPVLLAGPGGVAAIHAGWRGIAAGVVPATLERASPGESPESWRAWIGPAIGACCYEVGEEVAGRIAEASHPGVVVPGPGERPHADLAAAVRHQLEAAGLRDVVTVSACTRCNPERLWSYRRQGKGAGRNVAMIWRGHPGRGEHP
jgi:polyphenol oxidase